MKKIFLSALIITTMQVRGQLLVNLQLPSGGVVQKSQLWNMAVTNTSAAPLSIHIDLMFTDITNSMQVMSGSTQVIIVAPGSTQLNNSILQPIQYNILSQSYVVDPSPNGLLPVGDFEVCYSMIKHQGDVVEKIAEECQELIIEPLSPPQLVYPYDLAIIETKNPLLTWLPPMPVSLFTNLKYDIDLVEIYPNQSPSDAVQQNLPIYQQLGLTNTTLLYPSSARTLELNKQYAWRITAKNNEARVGQSETWVFSIQEFGEADSLLNGELPFAKLKKEDPGGYAIFSKELKFDYLNENADSIWHLGIVDLSTPEKRQIALSMDSIALRPGQNLVKYNVESNADFIDKHLYLLEIVNSRKEIWRLRFEYRE